jgi:anti-anti-sigma factor
MDFNQEERKGIVIKHVNLTRATKEHAEEFKKFLLKDINDKSDKIIVDLSSCEFIDSTFISSMVVALKAVNKIGGVLKLVANHLDVQSVLELTGMLKIFDIYRDVNEAIGSFR